MTDSQVLGADLDALKSHLRSRGRKALVHDIEDAMLAGSTSLEIHFRLRGALRMLRPQVADDQNAVRLIDEMVPLIGRITGG